MKAVIAIDSFKGSLSSLDAGYAVAEGAQLACGADTTVLPLADGGEGTVEALVSSQNGQYRTVTVCGPLGNPVDCRYGVIESTSTAVIEMAAASGITLIATDQLNPLLTTTYGVGEVILDAIKLGCRKFIIGLGGSATNDGGAGMLAALGFSLKTKEGTPIPNGAIGLKDLESISTEHVIPQLAECTFRIACDVKNPLCGENGCSTIFGPQKGAAPQAIPMMDEWLRNYAQIAKIVNPQADPDYPGAGAAGGLGFAFRTFTNAVLESGIEIVLRECHLEEAISHSDLVVTGEGRLDRQTVMGKAPSGVAKLAKKYGKPVIAFAGCVTDDASVCNLYGIDAFFPILRTVTTLDEALQKESAQKNLTAASEQAFRLIDVFTKK